ncbi:hypothetical protein D3C81_1176160 [compost metagenome]
MSLAWFGSFFDVVEGLKRSMRDRREMLFYQLENVHGVNITDNDQRCIIGHVPTLIPLAQLIDIKS